jgi:SAM-dependent MidA family methyltransferase
VAHPTLTVVTPWQQAWESALYGQDGFFLREAPLAHFRTNVASPLFAEAVRRLAGLVDEALGRPDPFDLVDLGAGRGELLQALPDVPSRWRLTGVDVATPPDGFPFGWAHELPAVHGLLFANEWLDNVPCPVLQDGRLVCVDDRGAESLGEPGPAAALSWADRWWPQGGRVEAGTTRDAAWAAAVAKVDRGLAVAVDYGHSTADRRSTLTGYRAGRQVLPVPDSRCDLTAHVALDSVAAETGSTLVSQRAALAALGISATLPEPSAPSYASGLACASAARELLDPAGLGEFGWLLKAVGVDVGWMGV